MTINQEALEEVRTAVAAVRDPEYPDLNIEQLGILEDVVADAAGELGRAHRRVNGEGIAAGSAALQSSTRV